MVQEEDQRNLCLDSSGPQLLLDSNENCQTPTLKKAAASRQNILINHSNYEHLLSLVPMLCLVTPGTPVLSGAGDNHS